MLAKDQGEIARLFSSPKTRELRFDVGDWTTFVTGAPVLVGSLVSLDCQVTQILSVYSHTLFIGEVMDVRLWRKQIDPLVYLDGRYFTQIALPG